MNKIIRKYGKIITSFAFLFALYSANTTCFLWCNQPQLPKEVKALRKF